MDRTLEDAQSELADIKKELLSDGYKVVPINKIEKGMTVVVPLIMLFNWGYGVYIDRFEASRCENGLVMIWNDVQTFHITKEVEIFIK